MGGIALFCLTYVGFVLAESARVHRELAERYSQSFRTLEKRASAVLVGAEAVGPGDRQWHRWAHGRSGLVFRGRSVAVTPDGLLLQVDVADPSRGDVGCLISFPDQSYLEYFYPERCTESRTWAALKSQK